MRPASRGQASVPVKRAPASRDAVLHLLRARALWQTRRTDEARNALNAYLAAGGGRL